MLKRKYGNRGDWKRVLKRTYQQTFHQDKDFSGYITLLSIEKVSEPLIVKGGAKEVCIVNDGYSWLQHFPIGKKHSLTTMFDDKGEIVQWYIDVCYEVGIENNTPWIDDLYLDIVVFPSGEIMLLDAEELDEALAEGVISKSMHDLAWEEARQVLNLIQQGKFNLIHLAKMHKEIVNQVNDIG
ncbi:DUF402 domain-containing protein [Ureibacillus aquaedulcis]|uniref:DUF402 domain-containing protein n=1 Tax=Ureibacillus aquaedulcis TaxID=3058421 RepID=A0ABT8GW34_9BACL|nr:DUF402 domain-containing protein [Ureibacillus sp. BA0131]MDN4495625.1 DUF402 domain-containing protein [Ureibacillus sp. BA0131]